MCLDASFYNAELAAGSQAFLSRTGVKVGTLNKTAAAGTARDFRAGPPAADKIKIFFPSNPVLKEISVGDY